MVVLIDCGGDVSNGKGHKQYGEDCDDDWHAVEHAYNPRTEADESAHNNECSPGLEVLIAFCTLTFALLAVKMVDDQARHVCESDNDKEPGEDNISEVEYFHCGVSCFTVFCMFLQICGFSVFLCGGVECYQHANVRCVREATVSNGVTGCTLAISRAACRVQSEVLGRVQLVEQLLWGFPILPIRGE